MADLSTDHIRGSDDLGDITRADQRAGPDPRDRSGDSGSQPLLRGEVVLPVAIHGSADMTHRRSLGRPRVRMTVGAPLAFAPAELPLHRRDWEAAAERVRLAPSDLVRATQFSSNQAVAQATPATAKARS